MRDEPLSPLLKEYFSVRVNEVISMIEKRLDQALKNNDMAKANSIVGHRAIFEKYGYQSKQTTGNHILNQEF
jgi:hypothetical protein